MNYTKKIFNSEIVPSISDIEREIFICELSISEKEKEVSDLSIKIQNIKINLNLFLGEYNSKVGLLYVRLDKLKLRIKEYQHRIDLAQGKRLSQEELNSIEEEVEETFTEERSKVDGLENEASESSEEYRSFQEVEDKRKPLDHEYQEELKILFRKLAVKFHPDKAKNNKQRNNFHNIMAAINEAYKNGDIETLKKYMKQAEREEKIAKETPEEKFGRLKEDYGIVLGIIGKLRAELEDLKASETYKLKEKVDYAKKESRDLLKELAVSIKEEISENQTLIEELVSEYRNIIGDIAY